MKIQHELFILDGINGLNFKVSCNDSIRKKRLERLISQFLEVGFERFFDSHVQKYKKTLKMIKWNRFHTNFKNE